MSIHTCHLLKQTHFFFKECSVLPSVPVLEEAGTGGLADQPQRVTNTFLMFTRISQQAAKYTRGCKTTE